MSAASNGGTPFYNTEILTLLGAVIPTPSPAGLVASFLPTNGIDQTPGIVAQPSSFCNTGVILTMTITDAGAGITYAKATITGKDCKGRVMTDTIAAVSGAGSATYYGTKVFYSDVVVTTHVDGAGAGDALSMGFSAGDASGQGGMGLPYDIAASSDIHAKTVDFVAEAGTLDTVNQVWKPAAATVPNGARRFRVTGRSTAA